METQALHGQDWVSELTGLKPATLEKMRWQGRGPRFVKLGSRCMYREADVLAWIEANVRTSTSDGAR